MRGRGLSVCIVWWCMVLHVVGKGCDDVLGMHSCVRVHGVGVTCVAVFVCLCVWLGVLASDNIGADGAVALAPHLGKLLQLQKLDLSGALVWWWHV